MRLLFFFLWVILPASSMAAVRDDDQTWVNVNAFIQLKPEWHLYLEAQPRFIDFSSKHGTTLYRAAIGKTVAQDLSLWLGYGFIERTNPTYLHEDRPFAQVLHGASLTDQLRLINRTRFEGRYFRDMNSPAFRLRHMVRGQYRFQGSKWGIVVYNEWFWHSVSHRQSGIREGFDQNRAFAGISYVMGDKDQHLGEVGYMNHYVNGARVDQSDDVLAMQFTFRY